MALRALIFNMLLFQLCHGFSQVTPFVLAPCGDLNRNSTLSLEWSLGEPVIESVITSSHLFTQGSHQPVVVLASIPVSPEKQNITTKPAVFPNPVKSVLYVQLNPNVNRALLSLFNLQGSLVFRQSAISKDGLFQVNLQKLPSSVYLLNIMDPSGGTINNYKIVKVK